MTSDGRTAQQRERRWMWWFAGAFLVMLVAGVGVGVGVVVTSAPDGAGDPGPSAGEWALILGLPVVVMVVVTGGALWFVLWRRRRGSALFARSPLWELSTQKQRRALVRDLRRGRPIDPEHRELALRTARDLTRRRGVVWLYLAVAVVQGANVAIQDGWSRWVSLAGVVLFLGAAAWFGRLVSRMRRAVEHLEQPPLPSSAP